MKKVRRKRKMYDPIKNNTWVMMFGFPAPGDNKYKRRWCK
jgi:hypothetical protein